MIFDKEKLQELIKEKDVKTTTDLQDLLRGITKEVIEAIYDGEITDHLGYKKHEQKAGDAENTRNGHSTKKVKSKIGEIALEIPRDRKGKFEPQIIRKYQKDISGIEEKVISMYAKGMSTRDIQAHIYDIYGYEISPETVSNITDSVIEKAREWQARPLQAVYPIVFMDGLVVKMRNEGHVRKMTVYAVIGVDLEGNKDCLGLYVAETESAKYWLVVMNELKTRGMEEILIFSVDNLSGISEAIESVFPKADIQKSVIHQIRNSLRYVSWKERRAVAADLKLVYGAATEQEGVSSLDAFEKKWAKKYPHIGKSWRKNWPELSTYFKYSAEIRRLIYTTNPIESFNRGIRKVTKNRAIFPNEDALLKVLYLAIRDMSKRWTQKIHNWGIIYSQLCIYFEERLVNYID
jgi:transposase-like protein